MRRTLTQDVDFGTKHLPKDVTRMGVDFDVIEHRVVGNNIQVLIKFGKHKDWVDVDRLVKVSEVV